MAIKLNVNPYTNPAGERVYRDKVYRTRIRFDAAADFPTRLRKWDDNNAPGYLNLLEVTGDDASERSALRHQPFYLKLEGFKVFVLRRQFDNDTLRIWFIVKHRGMGVDAEAAEEVKDVVVTANLVLTIETEEENIEPLPKAVTVEP